MTRVEVRDERVHIGHVELVPDATAPPRARFTRFHSNLADTRALIVALVLAQIVDALTTYVALGRGGYVEENPLMRWLVGASPAGTMAVKIVAILGVVALALLRLPLRRARVAVGVAVVLSLIGPLTNVASLLRP